MDKDAITLLQCVRDIVLFPEVWFMIRSTKHSLAPLKKKSVRSVTFWNKSEITQENIFFEVEERPLGEYAHKKILRFCGILAFCAQGETWCLRGEECGLRFFFSQVPSCFETRVLLVHSPAVALSCAEEETN